MFKKQFYLVAYVFLTVLSSCSGQLSPSSSRIESVQKTETDSTKSDFRITTSWNQPYWYFDAENLSGCASEENTGTSSECGKGHEGPLLTIEHGLIENHWLTPSPILPQTTTLILMSGESLNQESAVLSPIMVQGANFIIRGTPKLISIVTAGTVVPKSRTAQGGPMHVSGFPSNILGGTFVKNVKRNSFAFVDSNSDGEAVITQPFAESTVTIVTSQPTVIEDDSWSSGDNLELFELPLLNLKAFHPIGGDANGFPIPNDNQNVAWVQTVYIPDVTGRPSTNRGIQSTFAPISTGINPAFVSSYIEPFLEGHGEQARSWLLVLNSWMPGGSSCHHTNFLGGAINTPLAEYARFFDLSLVDADIIVHGTALFKGAYSMGGYAYFDGLVYPAHGGVFLLEPTTWMGGTNIYGPGRLDAEAPFSSISNGNGHDWQSILHMAQYSIAAYSYASAYVNGVYTDNIPINPQNMDKYGALLNVSNGARFSKTY